MQEIINNLLKIDKNKLYYLIIFSLYVKKKKIPLKNIKKADEEVYNFILFLMRNNLFNLHFLNKIKKLIKVVYIEKDSRINIEVEWDIVYKKEKDFVLYIRIWDMIYKRSLENDLFKLLW